MYDEEASHQEVGEARMAREHNRARVELMIEERVGVQIVDPGQLNVSFQRDPQDQLTGFEMKPVDDSRRRTRRRTRVELTIEGQVRVRVVDPGHLRVSFRRNSQGQIAGFGMWPLDDADNPRELGRFPASNAFNTRDANRDATRQATREYQEPQEYQAGSPYLACPRPNADTPRQPTAAPPVEIVPGDPGQHPRQPTPASALGIAPGGPDRHPATPSREAAAAGRIIDDVRVMYRGRQL